MKSFWSKLAQYEDNTSSPYQKRGQNSKILTRLLLDLYRDCKVEKLPYAITTNDSKNQEELCPIIGSPKFET